MSGKPWSPFALQICIVCDWLWCLAVIGACTYVVFWRGASGWWYLLAIFFASAWRCNSYRSPEQIAASPKAED